jgi:putative acetyltransferase
MSVIIREIQPGDNRGLASIIRTAFIEFDLPKVNTVYSDAETDTLYEVFRHPGSACFVAEENGILLGACGVYPTDGLPSSCAELVKFYLSPASRGKGIGKDLMHRSIVAATALGYKQLYLESFPQLGQAVGMYEKAGFKMLERQMGNSGHLATTIWMIKEL